MVCSLFAKHVYVLYRSASDKNTKSHITTNIYSVLYYSLSFKRVWHAGISMKTSHTTTTTTTKYTQNVCAASHAQQQTLILNDTLILKACIRFRSTSDKNTTITHNKTCTSWSTPYPQNVYVLHECVFHIHIYI